MTTQNNTPEREQYYILFRQDTSAEWHIKKVFGERLNKTLAIVKYRTNSSPVFSVIHVETGLAVSVEDTKDEAIISARENISKFSNWQLNEMVKRAKRTKEHEMFLTAKRDMQHLENKQLDNANRCQKNVNKM